MNEPFLSAKPIIQKLEEQSFEAYFVGGSVRDYLLNRSIADVDIATSATPEEVKSIFPVTVDTGIEHGTVLVIYNGKGYEVTTFRTETEYIDHRRPETVKFIRSLTEDLKRRDFTMNAIAMNIHGEIIDPFHGRLALQNRMIECVGNANERFQEDALRMMRAIRFVSQLNFSLEQETKIAIKANAQLLQHIAVERIFQECTKLFQGKNKNQAIQFLYECNLWNYLPELKNHQDLLPCFQKWKINQLSEKQVWLLLLFLSKTNNPTGFLKSWRMPTKKISYLSKALFFLHKRLKEEWTIYSHYQATKEISIDVESVYQMIQNQSGENIEQKISEIFLSMPIQKPEEMKVTGADLMLWFDRPGGPWIKRALEMIEKAILQKKISNEKGAIKGWILTCNLQ